MKKKINLTNVLLLGTVFLMFSGCTGQKKETFPKHLTFLIWGSPEEIEQIDGWIDRFEKRYREIKIDLFMPQNGNENCSLCVLAGHRLM